MKRTVYRWQNRKECDLSRVLKMSKKNYQKKKMDFHLNSKTHFIGEFWIALDSLTPIEIEMYCAWIEMTKIYHICIYRSSILIDFNWKFSWSFSLSLYLLWSSCIYEFQTKRFRPTKSKSINSISILKSSAVMAKKNYSCNEIGMYSQTKWSKKKTDEIRCFHLKWQDTILTNKRSLSKCCGTNTVEQSIHTHIHRQMNAHKIECSSIHTNTTTQSKLVLTMANQVIAFVC